jgi:spermidine/putrescine transport system ATP-binding protein
VIAAQQPTGGASERRAIDAQLKDIVKVYPSQEVPAVDGISLDIAHGEFFSLLGPSGCGKTTTLRMLAGLERPTAGRILIRGQDMTTTPAHRRPTNMVFQRLALFPHMSVAGNIAFGPQLQHLPRQQVRKRVDALLEMVHLTGYGTRLPDQLSGGQQQRVAIARALANEPALLLLDEPLASLDLKLRVQMQQSLKEIQRESSTTFVYVTHDQSEALTMSDRIAVMSQGRIEQVASPTELYERPATPFVATFIGDTNLLEGESDGSHLLTGGLRIAVPRPGTIATIRPERVLIGSQVPAEASNTFTGLVEQVTFLGSITRYRMSLPNGLRLLVERPSTDPTRLAAGTSVPCAIPVDAIVMVQPCSPTRK